MSRYIDLDKLLERWNNMSVRGRTEFDQEIMVAPSVIPQPKEGEWIPCSERMPEDSGNYLVCPSDSVLEDYSDFSEVMIMPYDADCEAFGWWIERYDPISLGFVDSDFNEFKVIAWMPLPKPWEGADDYERATEQMEHDALYEPTYNSEDGSM